ncbi:SOS response-associated peptidase [Halomonas sp. MCCC 1A17488]|uniref:Abasic site processing protein n=1 Tax=Billgrantia sulfidoxydans TaxID=2733484 RepID=A0ABX7VZ44_9GAMM|nr:MULTISPECIES: SOS response-associated peptidase [Halomonas]MCE8016811.1 SOS response-associated peptidase [Halomonas sp. MCCC 1A17488]MCG3240144.1 SOS response-associated peptidase [Halomonas sp. MCCC 1A17488]QPP49976.1 SOS response-associated peptidase [Halomonas sp. SS10-MC5]QTP53588.1 SOS response-associated peptidase [Halomonas sulfidoxydans]
MAGRLYIPPLDVARLLPDLCEESPLVTATNLAPRRPVSHIRLAAGRARLTRVFWGLTPSWLSVLDHAPHCARAESLEARPMFRDAFGARRSLVPVAGIYVWKTQPRFKQPFLVTRVDRGPMLLAAIWCRYHTDLTEHADSMALITVPTNAFLAPLGDRLPALIDTADAMRWLDPETPPDAARALLQTAPRELLGAFPVSRRVNDPANQDPACAHPTGPMLRWNEEEK